MHYGVEVKLVMRVSGSYEWFKRVALKPLFTIIGFDARVFSLTFSRRKWKRFDGTLVTLVTSTLNIFIMKSNVVGEP